MIDLAFKPVINPEPAHLSKAQIDAFNRLGFVAPIDVFDAQQARANVAYFVNRRPNGTHYRRAKGDHLAALRWG